MKILINYEKNIITIQKLFRKKLYYVNIVDPYKSFEYVTYVSNILTTKLIYLKDYENYYNQHGEVMDYKSAVAVGKILRKHTIKKKNKAVMENVENILKKKNFKMEKNQ